MVSCKGKHGIATEVRDTNLRFSMIITTPANRYQVGVTARKMIKFEPGNSRLCGEVKTHVVHAPFIRHKSHHPLSIVYSTGGDFSQGSDKSWNSRGSQRTGTSSHLSPFPAETARSLLLPLFTHSAIQNERPWRISMGTSGLTCQMWNVA